MKKEKNILEFKNKKAYHDYEFLEEEIAGLSLLGSEVKSIRNKKVSIGESYCYIQDGEMFITGMHISEYKQSGKNGHEPYRIRKLLMTKKQIDKWGKKLSTKGLTIVPVKLFVNEKGRIKLKLALAKGKKEYEKRDKIIQKQIDRETNSKINSR